MLEHRCLASGLVDGNAVDVTPSSKNESVCSTALFFYQNRICRRRLAANAWLRTFEPGVDYRSGRCEQFQADAPYDFVCITRSQWYALATADPLYDAIADAFIEPVAV
jgi:hypothetical protein